MKKVFIYERGWVKGDRISQETLGKVIGEQKVAKYVNTLKQLNEEDESVTTLSLRVNDIKYDLVVREVK